MTEKNRGRQRGIRNKDKERGQARDKNDRKNREREKKEEERERKTDITIMKVVDILLLNSTEFIENFL